SKGTRWLAPWKDSTEQPVIYHCVTRVVDRRMALGKEDKEKLRTFMRMQENFTGCRVLAYCIMCNHVHLLLEVPPLPMGGLSDEELLKRLAASCSEAEVVVVAKRLAEYRQPGGGGDEAARELHESYTYRMHDLGEFMKALLQRFSRWHNAKHGRTGTLWESRFKSVLVEDGMASRTMAAYIDLNPVRAGMVTDPADYRWSSYGEAMGGGAKGNGKKARAGLVRALMAHRGYEADARHWAGKVSKEYRMMLLAEGEEKLKEVSGAGGGVEVKVVRKGMRKEDVEAELAQLERSRDVTLGKMLRCRVRYFSDGAVLGSREFVDGVFRACRERFGAKRKSGARKLRGSAVAAAGTLWSVRDLQKGIG
ncbi:MAG: transposase, partial [Verrucomicrobia bacterium]|nr:transposase [Verrucomicrobiota bacterium]